MLPKDEFGNEMYTEVVNKFINAGATSKETAVDYTKIGVCPETRKADKEALTYLRIMNIVKHYRKKYYLDEKALEKPNVAYFKKILMQIGICFPIILVLVLLLFLLNLGNYVH